MPHLLIERLRVAPDFADFCCGNTSRVGRKKRSLKCVYVVEVLEIIAGILFVWGSVDFLPQFSEDPHVLFHGCMLFVLGGVLYFGVSMFCLSESIDEKGWDSLETIENALYVAGAFIFLVGTILYVPIELYDSNIANSYYATSKKQGFGLPVILNSNSREFQGSVLFIVGSIMFAFAAYANALNQRQFHDVRSQMLTATTTAYMFGSMLFVMGSVAFLPDLGCNQKMESFGAWCFIVGSLQFELGGWISFSRTVKELQDEFYDEEVQPLVSSPNSHKDCV